MEIKVKQENYELINFNKIMCVLMSRLLQATAFTLRKYVRNSFQYRWILCSSNRILDANNKNIIYLSPGKHFSQNKKKIKKLKINKKHEREENNVI